MKHTVILAHKTLEARGSEVQNRPQLHAEFEASVGFMRPWFKEQTNKTIERSRSWGCCSVVEHLSYVHETLCSV